MSEKQNRPEVASSGPAKGGSRGPHSRSQNRKAKKLAAESPMERAALSYAARGWHVFPAPPGEKKSYKSATFSGGRAWGATTNEKQIRRDFTRWPNANVGIATGPKSKIFVVDVDTPKGHGVDGIAALKTLERAHGRLPSTLMAESPSGSLHYYFNYPADVTIKIPKQSLPALTCAVRAAW
jgi:hypothetical protein